MSDKVSKRVSYGFFLLITCYFLSSVFKLGANIVIPYYAEKFHFSSAMNGFLSSSYFFSYALMQLVAGPLCKKYSSTRVVGTSMIVTFIGAVIFAFAPSTFWVFAARLLTGIGMGTIFCGVIQYETEFYTGRSYALAASLAFTATSLGSVCSAAPLHALISAYGIGNAFMILAFIVLVLVVALLLHSRGVKVNNEVNEPIANQICHAVKVISKSKYLIWGTVIWLSYVALQMCYSGMWCTTWAMSAFKDKISLATLNGSAFGIALMVGSFISEYCHRKSRTYIQCCIVLSWVFGLGCSGVLFGHWISKFWVSFAFILLFGFMSGHICVQLVAMCRDKTTSSDNSTITGLWNCLASFSVLFCQWTSGILIGKFGYNKSILIYVIIHLAATIGFTICCGDDRMIINEADRQ